MERDFLGLSDKKYMPDIKREVNDESVGQQGLAKEAAKQWGYGRLFPSDFQEGTAFPRAPYQWSSVSAASGFNRARFSSVFQNGQPLLLGGVAPSGSSPQLTIFYGGTVSVFNDISPEKAQAIMLCVGHGLHGETKDISFKKQMVRESVKVYGKQIHNATTDSSSSTATPDKHVAMTNVMNMVSAFNACPGSMIPSVPQARKASLARFLEKRKERLMSAMPYKKMLLDMATEKSSGMSYSSTSPI